MEAVDSGCGGISQQAPSACRPFDGGDWLAIPCYQGKAKDIFRELSIYSKEWFIFKILSLPIL
jgi:hypothetical protein